MKFRQQLDRWLTATTLASIKGGAVAVKAYLSVSVANTVGLPIAPLDLKQMGVVFIGGVLIHFNDSLATLQLPSEQTTVKPIT